MYEPQSGRLTSNGGLSIEEVRQCLGASARGLGALCRNASINQWAKWKPEARSQYASLTRSDRLADKYGFTVPFQTGDRPNNLLTFYGMENNGWQYVQRTGYYRLLDFACLDNISQGYLSGARMPVARYTPAVSMVYDMGANTFNVAAMIPTANTDEELGLDDIAAALGGTLYFGVCLFKATNLTPATALNARFEIATANLPISRSGGVYSGTSVSFSKTGMSSLDVGEWTIVPFISTSRVEQSGSWGGTTHSTTFYPLPIISPSILTIMDHSSQYAVNFTGLKQTLSLQGSVKIVNNTTSPLSLDVVVWIWDSSVSGTPNTRAKLSYEIERNKGSVTIPANDTVEVDSFTLIKGRDVTQQLYDYAVAYVRVGTDLKGPLSFLRINL